MTGKIYLKKNKIMYTQGVNSAARDSYCQVIYNDLGGLRTIKKFYSLPH